VHSYGSPVVRAFPIANAVQSLAANQLRGFADRRHSRGQLAPTSFFFASIALILGLQTH
jgi:hypothetical protein